MSLTTAAILIFIIVIVWAHNRPKKLEREYIPTPAARIAVRIINKHGDMACNYSPLFPTFDFPEEEYLGLMINQNIDITPKLASKIALILDNEMTREEILALRDEMEGK